MYLMTFAVTTTTSGCSTPYPSNMRDVNARADGTPLKSYTYSVTPLSADGIWAAYPFLLQYYFIATQTSTNIYISTSDADLYDCGPYLDNVVVSPYVCKLFCPFFPIFSITESHAWY